MRGPSSHLPLPPPSPACSPLLGGRPVTRRLRASSGVGTRDSPYELRFPTGSSPNEWTVLALAGANANGLSDSVGSERVAQTGARGRRCLLYAVCGGRRALTCG